MIPAKNKLIGVAGKFAGVGNKDKAAHPQANGGTGVFNMDVEGYMLDILHLSQSYRRKRRKTNLLSEISGAPKMMHFDLPERTSGKIGWRGRQSKKGARAKSWESDDVDIGLRRQQYRNGDSSERSLTPEPQLDRLMSSPEPVGKAQKRRFTISNVMHKVVRSPHLTNKKKYKMAKSSGDVIANPATTEREGEREEDLRKKEIRTGLAEEKEGEGEREAPILEEATEREKSEEMQQEGEGMEKGEEEKKEEREGEKESVEKQRHSSALSSSEQESLDFGEVIRERGLEDLSVMSPTHGIPKVFSFRGSSTPDLRKEGMASGEKVSTGDTEEIDLPDIEMREKEGAFVSPEPEEEEDEEEGEGRKSTIDWERVGEGGAVPGETTPTDLESRPSTSTPDLQSGSGSRLDMAGDQDASSDVWASPQIGGRVCQFFNDPFLFRNLTLYQLDRLTLSLVGILTLYQLECIILSLVHILCITLYQLELTLLLFVF